MHLALQVLLTAQALDKAAVRVFKPHRLTPAQFNVLNLLADQPAGRRSSELAEALIVDPSNITGLVKRMKTEGLLTKLEHPADRRQHIVGLTEKGRAVWTAAASDYEACLAALEVPAVGATRAGTEKILHQLAVLASSLP